MSKHPLLLVVFAFVSLIGGSASAQSDRLGAVAGTWEACHGGMQPLRARLTEVEADPKRSDSVLKYLRHRVAVELDRCAQLADTPLPYVVELTSRYLEIGMSSRALDVALRGMQRYGTVPDLQLTVAQVYFGRGQKERALPLLTQLAEGRNDAAAAQLLGAYYYEQGNTQKALVYLRVVADARPNQFGPNAALGDACLRANDLDCAGTYLNRASQLNPTDVLLAVKVAELQRTRGEYGLAIEAFERALQTDPNRVDAYVGLGRTLRAAELYESSVPNYLKAVQLAPQDPTPALEAAQVARRLGRGRMGLSLLAKHVDTSNLPEIHIEYVLSLLGSDNAARAAQHINQVASKVEQDDRWLAVRGDVQLHTGDLPGALAQYRSARKIKPQVEPYAVREARVLRMLGKSSEAVGLLSPFEAGERATKGEYVSALLDVARAKVAANDNNGAAETLAVALRVSPDDEDAKLAAAAVAIARGDAAGAQVLDDVAPSARRTAVEAWRAYAAGRFEEAAELSAKARDQKLPNIGVLQAAALARAGQFDRALQELARPGIDAALAAEWRGQTLVSACKAEMQAGRHAEAAKRVGKDIKELPDRFAMWLSRVPMVERAATGALTDADGQRAKSAQAGAFDHAVLAVLEIDSHPDAALRRLRSIPEGEIASRLRTRASLRQAALLFRRNNARAALAAIAKLPASSLPEEVQLNVAVIKNNKDPKELMRSMEPFVNKNVPEALFNAAMALDRLGKDGSGSIESLQKVVNSNAPNSLKNAAEALLAIKTKLYR